MPNSKNSQFKNSNIFYELEVSIVEEMHSRKSSHQTDQSGRNLVWVILLLESVRRSILLPIKMKIV